MVGPDLRNADPASVNPRTRDCEWGDVLTGPVCEMGAENLIAAAVEGNARTVSV